MEALTNIKTIFFDYDGTIHNSIYIYAPAFQKAYDYLVAEGLAGDRDWSYQEISYWLGFSPPEMWEAFMPDLSDDYKLRCSNIISEEMKSQMEKAKPVLYDGALEILEYLKNKGYHLVFISNCKTYYMESHIRLFSLGRYFDAFLCSEHYDFIPKYKIIEKVMNEYPERRVIIGDRFQDIEAGRRNNILTIGCKYGFGRQEELLEADVTINNIKELKQYL